MLLEHLMFKEIPRVASTKCGRTLVQARKSYTFLSYTFIHYKPYLQKKTILFSLFVGFIGIHSLQI